MKTCFNPVFEAVLHNIKANWITDNPNILNFRELNLAFAEELDKFLYKERNPLI